MTTTDQIKLIDDMIKEDDSYTIKDFLELRSEISNITDWPVVKKPKVKIPIDNEPIEVHMTVNKEHITITIENAA